MRRGFKNPLSYNLFRLIYFIPYFGKLYWRLFRDRRVPIYLKLMLVGALLYFLSPVDLIPEMLNPLLGMTDDVTILILSLKYFIKLAPKEVVEEHVKRIDAEAEGK